MEDGRCGTVMLSNKAKYGLKAVMHLARHDGPCLAADIASENRIPRSFMDAILLELTKAGILHSKKGRGGGYHLARPATRITAGQLIRILDGPLAPIACASRTSYRPCDDCADVADCPVRTLMLDVRDAMALILDRMTIASMCIQGAPL